jgi:hypothetical protein
VRQRRPARECWPLLLAALLLATGAVAGSPPLDQIVVRRQGEVLELSWADAEERLRGSVHPAVPRAGEPLHVDLSVGSFEGADFEGPLTLSLRPEGATHAPSINVTREAHSWRATFIPEHPGPHVLDVGFRSTRFKRLRAPLRVETSPVPRLVGWGVLGAGALSLLGYLVRRLLGEQRAVERAPAPTTGEPAGEAAPPVPPAEEPPTR